jgi:hypothetical protein
MPGNLQVSAEGSGGGGTRTKAANMGAEGLEPPTFAV